MDDLLRDLRFALRTMVRSPGFFVVAVLTLALGIGATTAIYTVVDGVLLRSLPYRDADRIVQLFQIGKEGGRSNASDPNFEDWRTQTRSFASIAQLADFGIVSVSGASEPVRVRSAVVSRDFFDVLGVQPLRGRLFAEEEMREGGTPAVVVSHGFWVRHLGGSPAALNGGALTFDGRTHAIVGVMPPSLAFPEDADLYTPREMQPRYPSRTAHNWQVIARLRDGVSLEQARRDLSAVSRRLKEQHGDETWMVDAAAVPLRDQLVGGVRAPLLILLAASAVLLLIACANVVNLLVARLATRQSELAVRRALGAGGGRLARQLLTESLVLALAGGVLGVVLAVLGVRALLALEPGNLPRAAEIGLRWPVLLFALGISIVVALALGAMGAIRGARGDIRDRLAQGQRTQAGGGSRGLRSSLVVAQVALTVVLLVGAGLLGRSFLRLVDVDPGFRTERAIVLDVATAGASDEGAQGATVRFYDDLVARLRAIPGVAAVGGVNTLPLGGESSGNGTFLIMSRPDEPLDMSRIPELMRDPSRTGEAEFRVASDGYFRAMRIPLVRGRLFDDRDAAGAPLHAAVISASLAKAEWPDEDPIGRTIQFGNMDGNTTPFTVVGVVGDVRERSLAAEPRPTFYALHRQRPARASGFNFVIQGNARPEAIVAAARQAVRELRPEIPPRFRTIETVVSDSVADRRFTLILLGAFGLAALLLATLGVYSVISYLVTQRTKEIGIRVALGARSGDVARMVLRQGAVLALVGIAVGAAAALGLTRLLSGLLYGVSPTDPVAFLGVILVLGGVALAASWIPARRAARVEPMQILRGG